MNINAYRERFIKRLEEITAEELKTIFEEVLDIKGNDVIKINNDILVKSVSNDYKAINNKNLYFNNFIKFQTGTQMIVMQSKVPADLSYKSSHYKVPKNTQGILKKAS